jgi:putative ubiquitin-RnfH superfamily antitoxin RatB of RatAB toxin-antitoxin module
MPLRRVRWPFMERALLIEVEVAYALPEAQFLQSLKLAEGSTVRDAIEASGVLSRFPSIELTRNPVGIFSTRVALDQVLSSGDRVEIYRALTITPVEARRLRALRKKEKVKQT